MKHHLSFGFLNVISDNLVELIVDRSAVIDIQQYQEFTEVVGSKPYVVLLNRIHNFNCTPDCVKLIADNKDIIAVASVRFFKNETAEVLSLVEESFADKINYQFFEGLKLGRSKAISWLEQELTNINSNV